MRTWQAARSSKLRAGCTNRDGTTVATAITNGRNGIGIELNAEYIALAEKRITGTQPALFGVGV